MKKNLLICAIVLFGTFVQAQTEKQFVKAGEAAYENGEYYEAIAYFKDALKFDKNNSNALQKVALSYYELKDYESAADYFEKINPTEDFPLLGFYKANNLKLLGDYKLAKAAFQNFYNQYASDDFYKKKAIHEVASCSWAMDQTVDTDLKILQFKKPLNTGFSDFAASYLDSNLIQVTSLQTSKRNMKDDFQAKLFFFDVDGLEASKSVNIKFPKTGADSIDIANGFYLAERKEFYFSKCISTDNGDKLCDIYKMNLSTGIWSEAKPLSVNTKEFTETQATVSVNNKGETRIYFVSDRDGGQGKLDIWTSTLQENGEFGNVTNLGTPVNTIDNESTPFYDDASQTLYFSSEWNYGFGGYDIFKSLNTDGGFTQVMNLGGPINSSANDQYYYPTPHQQALFASNREGAMQLRNSACCYDVFAHVWEEEAPPLDTSDLLVSNDSMDKPLEPIDIFAQSLTEQLPARVYFHNDEPNPKTTATKTKLAYSECYEDYKDVKPDYFDAFGDNQAIGAWFNKVDIAYEELQSFLETLELVLAEKSVDLTIEGYCSPLALNDYNIHLAKRRIVSLENHILMWNDGSLKKFYDAGDLTFTPAPFGEEKADQKISDSTEDVKYSIYDPKAAQERRVAIIAVEVQ